jgi:hypothetical protein
MVVIVAQFVTSNVLKVFTEQAMKKRLTNNEGMAVRLLARPGGLIHPSLVRYAGRVVVQIRFGATGDTSIEDYRLKRRARRATGPTRRCAFRIASAPMGVRSTLMLPHLVRS